VLPTAQPLDAETRHDAARRLVQTVIAAVEQGELSGQSPDLQRLEALSPETLTPRQLFEAIYRTERTVLDELALDEGLGAVSDAWPLVAELVRRASVEIFAALSERPAADQTPAAVRDPLTTLVIRPVFELALEQEAERAHRYESALSLLLFDVDGLSHINLKHGFGVGDRLLERLGILARRFFRTYDWIARHGDDSIAVLLPQTPLDAAASLAHDFRLTMQQRLILVEHQSGTRAEMTLSAAAVGTDRVQSEIAPGYIIGEAEAALVRAKMNGRNRTERVALLPTSLTILGAASLLDCSVTDVRRLVRHGQLTATRRGRHYHIDRSTIERYRQSSSHN
jgi:diguanylate cyclase (GGDEF)-like protein/excisionase family DNA binding protein